VCGLRLKARSHRPERSGRWCHRCHRSGVACRRLPIATTSSMQAVASPR
jgi:hypothetical protein